ncbi:MAG: DUF3179 domain-containing protein [Nitrospirae bacterium]|nr:DUF3179 domain-containing protein [Nitrospirota bacterium]
MTAALLALTVGAALAEQRNDFDLTGALVPPEHIVSGGPPRDGIPAIDRPRLVTAGHAGFLKPADRVLGLALDGETRAYPIAILNWHEIVNDTVAGRPVVITYCPLCGTGMAFDATVAGRARRFGVSGLLYNSDVLLYDRESESLWSQILGRAVSGPLKGESLAPIPLAHTTWGDWRRRHPDTAVLSTNTGYARDYGRAPYAGYADSPVVYFPTGAVDRRYHPKELVLGVAIGGVSKAYPFSELERAEGTVTDTLAGRTLTVVFDAGNQTARALDGDREIPSVIAFWFAWHAFHPEGAVFTAP